MPKPYHYAETLLDLENVCLSYGPKVILNNVNAQVRNIVRDDMEVDSQGQCVCFLGPSGIGKSQLARCIAGLQKPTNGSIKLTAEGLPTAAGLVGLVQQNYPLFPYMTVRQNLMTVLPDMGKIMQLFGQLGLADNLLDSYPKQLSGGQRQRVAIIRQLLTGNKLIILDEPFSGLDLIAKKRTCETLSKIAGLDTLLTLLIITHDVTEGMSIADKVWLMAKQGEGASIIESFDLAEKGLAWRPDIMDNPEFQELVLHVKHRFLEVA